MTVGRPLIKTSVHVYGNGWSSQAAPIVYRTPGNYPENGEASLPQSKSACEAFLPRRTTNGPRSRRRI